MLYEVPPVEQTSNDAEILAHALERYRSYGPGDARTQDYWSARARQVARKHASPIPPPEVNRGGSWNHPIAAAVLMGLMEDQRWNDVRQYCIWQLDGTHKGLWGGEGLSHIYPHPIPYLVMAYEKKQDPQIQRVLRAHIYLLTLQALPKSYGREPGEASGEGPYGNRSLPLHVCGGGMRSQWPFRGNVFLSYSLAVLLSPQAHTLPTWRNTHRRIQGWPCRVMLHSRHTYLSVEDRQLLWRHIQTPNPEPIVQELKALGVRSRARLEIARYARGQGYSFFATNTHASTPPLMAQSQVQNRYRTLGLHPNDLRGTRGGNSVGKVSAERIGQEIVGEATGVQYGGESEWPPCTVDGRPARQGTQARGATVKASIPIPAGDPIYRVVVDQTGVSLEGSTTTPPPPPPPNDPRVTQAMLLLNQALVGTPLEAHARTAATVLRRTIRGDRASALQGVKTLLRNLEQAG